MKKFLKSHQDFVLGFFAVVFVSVVVWYFVWGISFLAGILQTALSPSLEQTESATFDLEGARRLGITLPDEPKISDEFAPLPEL